MQTVLGVSRPVLAWIYRHATFITLSVGSLIITVWTLLRFFTKPVIYDMVGQQVLANQWLNGHTSGSVIGPTNYILKMFFIYMPFHFLPISIHVSLIVMTLSVNIATFVILFFALKKLLILLQVPVSGFFYIGTLWLAEIAGSVFWIQFTNSRNLEVAAGVLLIYLGIKFIFQPTVRLLVGLAVLATLLFFDDPLQLYMTAFGLIVFLVLLSWKQKRKWGNVVKIVAVLIGAWLVSRSMTFLIQHIFSVSFSQTNSLSQLSVLFDNVKNSIVETAKANVQLVSGAYDAGRLREIGNLLFIIVALGIAIFLFIKRHLPKVAILFVVVMIVVIELVYLASGQALSGGDTSRYLIMLAPILIIVISLGAFLKPVMRRIFLILFGLIIGIATLLLGITFIHTRTTQFPTDAHVQSIVSYLQENHFSYAYASMDSSLSTSYFYPHAPTVLPLSCDDTLAPANLFFDKSLFTEPGLKNTSIVPVILDGSSISNAPHVCTESMIIGQFGKPMNIATTNDGNVVLLYSNSQTFSSILNRTRSNFIDD